jgi:NAD(P)-dependent dehydrogenase (short-subunit alcohol dehydrogenase family)
MTTTSNGFTEADVTDQSGKCFIVTGANTGIGFDIARVLAMRGARVLLACRDRARADEAMGRIRQGAPGANLAFLPLDLSDLDSVRTAARMAEDELRIDVLINNAGVMTPPLTYTRQGFELQFGVNHVGTFALSALLLPKLGDARAARIVTTSSLAHRGARIDWDDLHADKRYHRLKRYAASKLANALFFFELDRRLRANGSGITSVGCHPGVAATDIARNAGPLRLFAPLVRTLLNSAERGAWPALQAATATVSPGAYYGPLGFGGTKGPSGAARRAPEALDVTNAERLWQLSVDMTGIDPELSAA